MQAPHYGLARNSCRALPHLLEASSQTLHTPGMRRSSPARKGRAERVVKQRAARFTQCRSGGAKPRQYRRGMLGEESMTYKDICAALAVAAFALGACVVLADPSITNSVAGRSVDETFAAEPSVPEPAQ